MGENANDFDFPNLTKGAAGTRTAKGEAQVVRSVKSMTGMVSGVMASIKGSQSAVADSAKSLFAAVQSKLDQTLDSVQGLVFESPQMQALVGRLEATQAEIKKANDQEEKLSNRQLKALLNQVAEVTTLTATAKQEAWNNRTLRRDIHKMEDLMGAQLDAQLDFTAIAQKTQMAAQVQSRREFREKVSAGAETATSSESFTGAGETLVGGVAAMFGPAGILGRLALDVVKDLTGSSSYTDLLKKGARGLTGIFKRGGAGEASPEDAVKEREGNLTGDPMRDKNGKPLRGAARKSRARRLGMDQAPFGTSTKLLEGVTGALNATKKMGASSKKSTEAAEEFSGDQVQQSKAVEGVSKSILKHHEKHDFRQEMILRQQSDTMDETRKAVERQTEILADVQRDGLRVQGAGKGGGAGAGGGGILSGVGSLLSGGLSGGLLGSGAKLLGRGALGGAKLLGRGALGGAKLLGRGAIGLAGSLGPIAAVAGAALAGAAVGTFINKQFGISEKVGKAVFRSGMKRVKKIKEQGDRQVDIFTSGTADFTQDLKAKIQGKGVGSAQALQIARDMPPEAQKAFFDALDQGKSLTVATGTAEAVASRVDKEIAADRKKRGIKSKPFNRKEDIARQQDLQTLIKGEAKATGQSFEKLYLGGLGAKLNRLTPKEIERVKKLQASGLSLAQAVNAVKDPKTMAAMDKEENIKAVKFFSAVAQTLVAATKHLPESLRPSEAKRKAMIAAVKQKEDLAVNIIKTGKAEQSAEFVSAKQKKAAATLKKQAIVTAGRLGKPARILTPFLSKARSGLMTTSERARFMDRFGVTPEAFNYDGYIAGTWNPPKGGGAEAGSALTSAPRVPTSVDASQQVARAVAVSGQAQVKAIADGQKTLVSAVSSVAAGSGSKQSIQSIPVVVDDLGIMLANSGAI